MPQNLQPNQALPALTRQVLKNLAIAYSSNTQVVIKQDSIAGSDDGEIVLQAAADITVAITTSGVNGLDTGSEAPSTWYFIYMIFNPASGLIRGLLSASVTSPILPSGYTKKKLIGAVMNDSGSNFVRFYQRGTKVQYPDIQILVSAPIPPAPTPLPLAAFVPTGTKVVELFAGCTVPPGFPAQEIFYVSGYGMPGTGGEILWTGPTGASPDYRSSVWEEVLDAGLLLLVRSTSGAMLLDVHVRGFTLDL
jgi:hypothetical protein